MFSFSFKVIFRKKVQYFDGLITGCCFSIMSALSFPSIPAWLGIHVSVISLLVLLRRLIILLVISLFFGGFWILISVLRESVSILKVLLGIFLIIWIAFWITKASEVNMLFRAGNLNLCTEPLIIIANAMLCLVLDASVKTNT